MDKIILHYRKSNGYLFTPLCFPTEWKPFWAWTKKIDEVTCKNCLKALDKLTPNKETKQNERQRNKSLYLHSYLEKRRRKCARCSQIDKPSEDLVKEVLVFLKASKEDLKYYLSIDDEEELEAITRTYLQNKRG